MRARSLRSNSTDAEQKLWSLLRGHADSKSDEVRAAFLNAEGYSLLRFWNDDTLNAIEGVFDSIVSTLAGKPSPDLHFAPASLPLQGRGERGARAASTKKRSYRLNAEPISE